MAINPHDTIRFECSLCHGPIQLIIRPVGRYLTVVLRCERCNNEHVVTFGVHSTRTATMENTHG